ncbi:MAG: hypothetical protein KF850_04280 [Labilithrix sp.]|nr:hypothetical protein [Labilithrix sp.]MBX3211227.1 hypothetical protein [Labilithrix sp.]
MRWLPPLVALLAGGPLACASSDQHGEPPSGSAAAAADGGAVAEGGGAAEPSDLGARDGGALVDASPDPDGADDGGPPSCRHAKAATIGTSERCTAPPNGAAGSTFCPASCGGGHVYTCSPNGVVEPEVQPAGLSCYTLDRADPAPPYVCCTALACVRSAALDGPCGANKAFHCPSDVARPAGCTPHPTSGYETLYSCCPP